MAADLMATMLAHPLLTFCIYCGLVITVMGWLERDEGMDDAEMYLFAEPNPLAGKQRADLIAMGLMPVDPRAEESQE